MRRVRVQSTLFCMAFKVFADRKQEERMQEIKSLLQDVLKEQVGVCFQHVALV